MVSAKGISKLPPTDEEYSIEVERFKEISNQLGRPLKFNELTKCNLRDGRWYIKHSRNDKVQDFNSFIEFEIDMIPRYNISKEAVIERIMKIQSMSDIPLTHEDVIDNEVYGVGEHIIARHWGNFNNMKRDLGLEIVKENPKCANRTLDSVKNDVTKLCNYILEHEYRKLITISDWEKLDGIASYGICLRWFLKHGLTLREFINSIGFEFVKSGDGLNFFFDDKEQTRSKYELAFSKWLRSLGLSYNTHYYRDVRYRTFIPDYKGFMDCDYIIKYKNRIIYIEIAGVLRDYKEWYYQNKSLNSKSREKYRLTLMKKEEMLKNMQLEYYILFPCDINQDTFKQIFK